jgi:hypothetical protein
MRPRAPVTDAPPNREAGGATSDGPGGEPLRVQLAPDGDEVPQSRPWARRDDRRTVECRFRRDRASWKRRIAFARRTSYDGADPLVAPYAGRWTR